MRQDTGLQGTVGNAPQIVSSGNWEIGDTSRPESRGSGLEISYFKKTKRGVIHKKVGPALFAWRKAHSVDLKIGKDFKPVRGDV